MFPSTTHVATAHMTTAQVAPSVQVRVGESEYPKKLPLVGMFFAWRAWTSATT